jgi:hypothetical protein
MTTIINDNDNDDNDNDKGYEDGYPIIEKDTFYNNANNGQINKFNKAMRNLSDFIVLKGLFMKADNDKIWAATNEEFHYNIMNFLHNHTNIKRYRFWNDLNENQRLYLCRSVTFHENIDDNDQFKFNINFDDNVAQVGVVFNGSVTITANLHPQVKKCKIGQCFGAIEKFDKLFYKEGEGEDPYNPRPKKLIVNENINDITIIKQLPLVETIAMEGRGALLVFHISSVQKAMAVSKSIYKKSKIMKKGKKVRIANDTNTVDDDDESLEFDNYDDNEADGNIPIAERLAKSTTLDGENFSEKLAALGDDDGLGPLTVSAVREMADFEIPEHYVITEADAYCIRVRKLSRKSVSGVLYEYLHASEMLPKLHEDISSKYIQTGNAGRQTLIRSDNQMVYIVIQGCIKVQIERIVKNSGSISVKKKGEKALHIKTKTMPLLQLENGGILNLDDECFKVGQSTEADTSMLLSKSLSKLPKVSSKLSNKKGKVEELYKIYLQFEQPTSYLAIPIKKFRKALIEVPKVTSKRITEQLTASTQNVLQRITNLLPWINGTTLSLHHNMISFNDDTDISYSKSTNNPYSKDTLISKGYDRLQNKEGNFDPNYDVVQGLSKDYSKTLNDEIKAVITQSQSQQYEQNKMYPLIKRISIKDEEES